MNGADMGDKLLTAAGRRIAFDRVEGRGPGVLFLGGFKSDKEGTKALALSDWAKRQGRAFVRFDYSGHGASSGAFLDGAISDWAEDAGEVLARLCDGPQVLVGSSMGGWIGLLLARRMPERVAGFVGIAAAPDFTEDLMWARFTGAERAEMAATGRVAQPSDYSDEPYILTRRLIEDGRRNLVLRMPLGLDAPVRLLQGTADEDVPVAVAERLFAHLDSPDARLTLVKGADHRFSTPDCLSLIEATVEDVLARV